MGHSISPTLHSAVYAQLGIDAKYDKIHVPEKELGAFVESLKRGHAENVGERIGGINVTIPHKIAILPFLDEVNGDASLAGAVNTVVRGDGANADHLTGYNTDMDGLLRALQSSGTGYKDNVVCIVGAGGAAIGAAVKAALEGAKVIRVVARNMSRAGKVCALASEASGDNTVVECVEFKEGSIPAEAVADADIFLNATPMGMSETGVDFTGFTFMDAMPKNALVYDCVYVPAETSLIKEARSRGLGAENGLSMLVWQGLMSDVYFLRAAGEKQYGEAELLTQELFEFVYGELETAMANKS